MKKLSLMLVLLSTSPALAASGAFFSLHNTNFIVLLAFLLFVGVVFYFKVPSLLGGLLDKRADGIRSDLEHARKLREEAQVLLASYERKHKEVQEQAERIVEAAKREAAAAAEQAKLDLEASIARRIQAAIEQISSAEARAVKDVRDRAIAIAVAAAGDVIAQRMTAKEAGNLIDTSIEVVAAKLH